MFSRTLSCWGRMLGWKNEGKQPEEQERRAWGRVFCDRQAICQLAGPEPGDPITVRVINVSAGGIGLIHEFHMQPGQLLRLVIPHSVDEAEVEVLACVIHCQKLRDGQYNIGCTFPAPLDAEELNAFASDDVVHISDRRAWQRHPSRAQARFQKLGMPESLEQPAQILNISISGIGLEVDQEIHVGALLNVRLFRNEQPVLTALASVVRSIHQPTGEWIIGCNFIEELNEAVLNQLLD